jgi:phosphoribosylaminoimidazolecarboxamide formyltransferase/IMP cyclohydrolase
MPAPEYALISVADKNGLAKFADGIHGLGTEIWGSRGTAKFLNEEGIPARNVAELVGGDPILDHRVVTLSRELYAGLLADPDSEEQMAELKTLGLPFIDIVCVDSYALHDYTGGNHPESKVIDQTDVGGPTMLHAAAKGRRIVLSKAEQRPIVLDWLRQGMPNEQEVRRTLAFTAEQVVADYIAHSAQYLGSLVNAQEPVNSYEAQLRGLIAA